MSRHRAVRNRAYSYEDDEYDDDYGDEYDVNSPDASQFMYRRDSPSRMRSVFSFVDQQDESVADDAELLEALVPQVKQIAGVKFADSQIVDELRAANYDTDKTVISLLEKSKTMGVGDSRGTLPLQITVPKLEAVALSIGQEAASASGNAGGGVNAIKMPTPVKGKAAAIGVSVSPSKEAAVAEDKPKRPTESVPSPAGRFAQLTPAEKKSYEKAELKVQEQAAALSAKEASSQGKTKISMVVVGHVDAGKSTITGHLLYNLGYVSKKLMHKYEKESREAGKASFAYAWVMDADDEERSRGVTMDIGTSYFETASRHVTLLDAPGHRDFIPKMIAGASQADVALLVVPAATGEFEAAFENSGQTKEHTLLVRSLGVAQMIVAVNKMDSVGWDKERFDQIVKSLTTFLQSSGFRLKNLWFVPLSGLTGANLEKKVDASECAWYTGPSLVDAIDQFAPPQRQIAKPFRMAVSDVSKSLSLGQTISGRIYSGAVAPGSSLLLMPVALTLTVKAIEQDGKLIPLARAGDNVDLGVTNIDPSALSTGSILCSIASPVRLARRFEAKIMTMPTVEVPLVKGTCMTIHIHNVDEPVHVSRLVSILSKTGEVERRRPRCITRERSAVVHVTSDRPICLEAFADFRQLGRFTLRDRGKTLAAGIITEILG